MARKQRSSLSNLYTADSFDRSLEAQIASFNPRPARSRGWLLPAAVLGSIAAIVGVFSVWGNDAGAQSNHDLAGVSRTFLTALAQGDTVAALQLCAESAEGQRILAPERRRVFGELSAAAEPDPQALANRLHTLNRLREELADDGVQWDDIEPLAIGGVRARVLEPSLMKEPASLVWGHLYFSHANRVFAIEVTAWQCGARFIIADVWDWAPVAVSPNEVESFAKDRSRRFLDDRGDAPDDTKIIRPRRLFLAI